MGLLVDPVKYEAFCAEVMKKNGVLDEAAEIVAKLLVQTDMMGTTTHGTINIDGYMERVKAGGVDGRARPEIIKEGPSFAIVDGHAALGPYSGLYSMDVAMKKAKETGMAYVATINSQHYGACGVYSNYAAEKGFLAITVSNTNPNMNVPGSKGKGISNSPISYALPSGIEGKHPIFMDIALSQVAALKVFGARDAGQTVPMGWIVDKDGRPTDTPVGTEWSLLPIGMHKGYCLAFLVKILCEVLSGGAPVVGSWLNGPKDAPTETSHACIVLDISRLADEITFAERMNTACEQMTSLPKAEGNDRIWLPGEMEWERYDAAVKNGLMLGDATLGKITAAAEKVGMSPADCTLS